MFRNNFQFKDFRFSRKLSYLLCVLVFASIVGIFITTNSVKSHTAKNVSTKLIDNKSKPAKTKKAESATGSNAAPNRSAQNQPVVASKPESKVSTPASQVAKSATTPVVPGDLSLSTNSITVGPNQPASVTVTPSPGSMFYTIFVQGILNVSCSVSVLNNVTAPFTVTYSFPPNQINKPTPGTYNLVIHAQDRTKAMQDYNLQVTVLPSPDQ